MSDVANLSAEALHGLIAEANARWDAAIIAVDRTGFSHAIISEMTQVSTVAREYVEARRMRLAAVRELDLRRAHHGTDYPIRRSA